MPQMSEFNEWRPTAGLLQLQQRARLLQHIRQWFAQQNVLEVETPQISAGATTDPHIDSFVVTPANVINGQKRDASRCLRTSAEFHMKRLLASGSGDIYELGKVFRVDESGRYHNPEFTMLEWYRVGLDHHQLVDDVESLLKSLHGQNLQGNTLQSNTLQSAASTVTSTVTPYPGLTRISYRDLWSAHCNVDIAHATCAEIKTSLETAGCDVPDSIANDFDTLLDLGMSSLICHRLPPKQYTVIVDYPASQASLARIDNSDSSFAVACRFEFYYGSVELANGYHELTDAVEQRNRFEADNAERQANGKPVMPVDEAFLLSMQAGLPDCAGVAIGVDRLLMVLLPEVSSLQQVLSFSWDNA